MKKITLMLFAMLCVTFSFAQHTFAPIAGPTNVAAGSPVTLNLNDIANSVGVPAGAYGSFTITVDWVAGGGGPWSSEAELQVSTTAGIVADVDPPSGGSGSNGNPTTLTFSGNLSTVYDPSVDGLFDIILGQSYAGSDGDWSNISVTIDATVPAPPNDTCAGVIDLGGETSPLTASTLNANNDFGQDCLTNTGAPDVVYSIDVPDGFRLTIEQTSNTYDSKHRLAYGTSCPGDMLIVCTDDPDTNQEQWDNTTGSVQTVYWIQSAFSTGSGEFTLAWTVEVLPSCEMATGLAATPTLTTADITWTAPTVGTPIGYNWEIQPDGVAQGTSGAPATGSTTAPVTSDTATGLAQSTPYDLFVQTDCGVDGTSMWAGPFSFTTASPPPANDDCANATNIAPSATAAPVYVTGTTAGNTASGEVTDADMSCVSAFAFGSGRDTWYMVEVPLSGEINVETQASAGSPLTDTIMTVFSGSCGALTEVGCDDDGGAGNFSLVALTGQTPGEVLLVRVQEYAAAASRGPQDGPFEIAAYAADPSLGLQDVAFEGFKYFPNPVNGTLSLRAQDNIQAASMYNMLGQEVLRTTPNGLQDELDMSGLNTGAYFLKVRINDVEQNFRIIKQ
jgi:hypothetical protein